MNYGVARIETRTRESIGKFERHNERKNDSYSNRNVDLSETHRNVHFKTTGNLSYNEYLDRLIAEGKVSLRGLKKDAKVFDELILDVNSSYFDDHGGYEYAVRFYEAAYHFAEELYGRDNIVSAVMHADEVNLGISRDSNHIVYHYHLHVMALPVVEKKILWTKRCKDPALVGTVKEVVHQISHSKKWASNTPMLDENGQPILQKNGKPKFVASYSILQDRFLEYMQQHGFSDIQRGVRGSTAEHLSSLDYKISKDTEQLKALEEKIQQEQEVYAPIHEIHKTVQEVNAIGKPNVFGKVQMSKDDYATLTQLAGEGITSREEIRKLREHNSRLVSRLSRLQDALQELQERFDALEEKCRPFLDALEHFPDLVKTFVAELQKRFAERKKDAAPEVWRVHTEVFRKNKNREER